MPLQPRRRIALVAACGLLIAAGFALWAEPATKQPRGRMLAVRGHRMHLVCTGSGEPPVILEAAQTGISALWTPVQKGIAAFTQVCSYDRAGFGFSDPGPLPRTSAQIATELRGLLRSASIQPPYVMVGASAGGFHVLVYAGTYLEDVAGVVLVDSSHPDQAQKLHLPENPTAEYEKWERFFPLGHSLGFMKFGLRQEKPPASFSPAEWSEVLDARNTVNSYRTLLREGDAWAESARQVRESPHLGAKPLLVLTGGRDADGQRRALWVNGLQADLTRLSSKGRQRVIENSGHAIMLDAPKDVVEGLRATWNEARARGSR